MTDRKPLTNEEIKKKAKYTVDTDHPEAHSITNLDELLNIARLADHESIIDDIKRNAIPADIFDALTTTHDKWLLDSEKQKLIKALEKLKYKVVQNGVMEDVITYDVAIQKIKETI